MKAIIGYVADLYTDRSISQEKLGALAGVSREIIGLVERDQWWVRLSPSHRMIKELNVSIDELLKGVTTVAFLTPCRELCIDRAFSKG